jgi:phosphate-selective porin
MNTHTRLLRIAFSALALLTPGLAQAQSGAAPAPPVNKVGPVGIYGYFQADSLFYLGDHPADLTSTFRVRRARIGLTGDVSKDIAWTFMIDVVTAPIPRDVYLTFKWFDAANVRVGQFITPFSAERLTSSAQVEAIDRSLESLVPSRDAGVMVFNAKPFLKTVSYSVAVVNGTGQNVRDNNTAKDVVGRLALTPPRVPGLSIGIDGAAGKQPKGTRKRVGADVTVDRLDYKVAAEFVRYTQDVGTKQNAWGYYVIGVRRLRPEQVRPNFYMAELVARYVLVPDAVLTVPSAKKRELQFGGNYYVTPGVRFMMNLDLGIKPLPGVPKATLIGRLQLRF